MMSGLLSQIEFWHWWIFGVLLAILELMAPGSFFLWLGVSAGATGLVLLAVPDLVWELQFLLFAALSVATVVAWRLYLRRHPTETDDATLNRRAEQYVGRVFSLEQPIVNGRGSVRVGDGVWRAEGPELPAGERVRVIGVAGVVLRVEKAET